MEVKDSSGEAVLQVVLIGQTAHIQGIWRDKFGGGAELVTDNNGTIFSVIQWYRPQDERKKEVRISPIFRYPSSEHWGEKIPRLFVDDFELSAEMTVVNNSSKSLIALKATVKTTSPNHTYYRDLDVEVGPDKTVKIAFPRFNWVTLPPTEESFDDQWKSANEIDPGCVGINFLTGANHDWGRIWRYYQKSPLPHDEALGVISYREKTAKTVATTEFPLEAFVIRVPGCTYVKVHD